MLYSFNYWYTSVCEFESEKLLSFDYFASQCPQKFQNFSLNNFQGYLTPKKVDNIASSMTRL